MSITMLLETALVCLSLNIYHEAKNQSIVGQAAVAEVVIASNFTKLPARGSFPIYAI